MEGDFKVILIPVVGIFPFELIEGVFTRYEIQAVSEIETDIILE